MNRKLLVTAFIVVLLSGAGTVVALLVTSLPQEDGTALLRGLSAKTTVHADRLGIPDIVAGTRKDAYRALGFLHARDRLFQMDLMRRKSAGRLAELFGMSLLKLDRRQRVYQLDRAANKIVASLPNAQRQVLDAYADGVNAYIEQSHILPPEFLALRYRPEIWRAQDSILVALGMFQNLNGHEQDERMVSVMEKALPADLLEFLTPDSDVYATVLVGGTAPRRLSEKIPVDAFAALPGIDMQAALQGVDTEPVVLGSNNWVVAGTKTADGRAIVANDMHLGLGVPNIWYRASLQYNNLHLYGVTLPGVPVIIAGANDDVAWGFTNVSADLLDLISLDVNPDNPEEYNTPRGWTKFSKHSETIRIKDAPDFTLELRNTIWGPVSEQPLLGRLVAVKWAALETHAVDLGLLAMDQARTTQAAMQVMNQAGGPPQNVVIADRGGHIGWTYMGRFPVRAGFNGITSRSWAGGAFSWHGFIPPDDLPRLYDPPEGFIVTANNRTLGKDYPYGIAHNWALGYRAYRIAELLRGRHDLTEKDLLNIQLDTRAGVFDFYRQLALAELRAISAKEPVLKEAEQALQAWDGHMNADSRGAAFLKEFRSQLAQEVFAKVVAACRSHDPDFKYAWRELETPLRVLLTQRPQGILSTDYHDDWQQLIIDTVRRTYRELHEQYPATPVAQLTWGATHQITLHHPFSKKLPVLAEFLDMSSFESGGCASVCVKVISAAHGASERLVVSPSHPEDAILHMPGGQSGHPLSEHYRDQQPFWRDGTASPLQFDVSLHTLQLLPE